MDKQGFAIVIVTRPGYVHSEAFREIAETIYFGLAASGEDVIWSDTAFVPGRMPIVFGANLVARSAELPANAIIFSLHPPPGWRVEGLTIREKGVPIR